MLEIVTVWLPIPDPHPHQHHLPNRNLVPRAHRPLCALLRMPAETSWLQLQLCALYQSHVLFIEVKKRNHAISGDEDDTGRSH